MKGFWDKFKIKLLVFKIGLIRRWDSFIYNFKDETLVGQQYYVFHDPQTGKNKIKRELITKESLERSKRSVVEGYDADDAIQEGLVVHIVDSIEQKFQIKVSLGPITKEDERTENISS